jgi:hypothetical protein
MTQALTDWPGGVGSLIAEMKRRASVRTDHELAGFGGWAQSTVANWRKRGAVPEAALLHFEQLIADPSQSRFSRLLAARTIAMRLPELSMKRFHGHRLPLRRYVVYASIAYNLNAVASEIARQMERLEAEHGLSSTALAQTLIEDEQFLNGVLDWLGSASMSDMLAREQEAIARVMSPDQ